jgi:two-component system chemotaxis response regulator CheB
MESPRIVVIGASAGGFAALTTLAAELPKSFPAVVFAVLHVAPNFPAADFVAKLGRVSGMRWKLPDHGERFAVGTGYVAPPGGHMLVKEDTVLVTTGAHENGHRPAIDPLFRSAAVAHGSRVVGVVLTGMLDDGTAGLEAVERCGGVTVVQDPQDAAFPAMPQSAIDHVRVLHRATIAEMGALLDRLVRAPVPESTRAPEDVAIEATIAERVVTDVHAVDPLLLADRQDTLWITLRMLEERRNLAAASVAKRGSIGESRLSEARAREADLHIERIRALLGAGH